MQELKDRYIKQYINLAKAIISNFRPFLLVHKNSQYWSFFRIVNLDFQYYSLIHQAFMELIKFTKVYNTGLLIAMY